MGLPQIVSSTDVWPPPFFTFEYFASLDNHRAQKDSSTADTYIYYTYYIYILCAKCKFPGKPYGCGCAPRNCVFHPRVVLDPAAEGRHNNIGLLGTWVCHLGVRAYDERGAATIYMYGQTAQFVLPNVQYSIILYYTYQYQIYLLIIMVYLQNVIALVPI